MVWNILEVNKKHHPVKESVKELPTEEELLQ